MSTVPGATDDVHARVRRAALRAVVAQELTAVRTPSLSWEDVRAERMAGPAERRRMRERLLGAVKEGPFDASGSPVRAQSPSSSRGRDDGAPADGDFDAGPMEWKLWGIQTIGCACSEIVEQIAGLYAAAGATCSTCGGLAGFVVHGCIDVIATWLGPGVRYCACQISAWCEGSGACPSKAVYDDDTVWVTCDARPEVPLTYDTHPSCVLNRTSAPLQAMSCKKGWKPKSYVLPPGNECSLKRDDDFVLIGETWYKVGLSGGPVAVTVKDDGDAVVIISNAAIKDFCGTPCPVDAPCKNCGTGRCD